MGGSFLLCCKGSRFLGSYCGETSADVSGSANKDTKFGDAPWNVGKSPAPAAKGGAGGGHPRKSGKEFQTERDGNQICFAFAKGALGACPEPCKNQRTHCCQCLGAHPNAQRTKNPKGQKPGGKGK